MNYITNMSQKERIFLDSSVIIGLFSGGNLTVIISGWRCGNIWLAYPRNTTLHNPDRTLLSFGKKTLPAAVYPH